MTYKENINQYLIRHGFEAFHPKAVLFDMDGVLYDSMPHHVIAWHDSMEKYGIIMTEEDVYATEGARGIDTIRQMVKNQKGIDISLDEAQRMYDLKSNLFHAMGDPAIFDGVIDFMQKIRKKGMVIGVVTGSGQKPLIHRLLNDFGEFLDERHIVTAYDVEKGKPNPDPYLMGLRKCGNLQPWEGIVVENAPLGVQAGVAARCFTIAVNSGPLPDEKLSDADVIFHRMTELADVFERIVD